MKVKTGPGNAYPSCWPKVSRLIRRLASGHCERCGQPCDNLSVHHQGVPFANGRPGNSHDKHDLRRENLQALCFRCHDELDHLRKINQQRKQQKAKRAAKREAHQALGVGTGLVPLSHTMHVQVRRCHHGA